MTLKTYLVYYSPNYAVPVDEDGVPYHDLLEIWGTFTAANRAEAIEIALQTKYAEEEAMEIAFKARYGDDNSNVVPIFINADAFAHRSISKDRPHMHAELEVPLLKWSDVEPMKSKQHAEAAFYSAIGGELQRKCIRDVDGRLLLDGTFTSSELRKIADAFDIHQATLEAIDESQKNVRSIRTT
jgi:hypothetical protein